MLAALLTRLSTLCALLLAVSALASEGPGCRPDMAWRAPAPVVQPATVTTPPQDALFTLAALAKDQARLTFLGHATFLIESAGGITAATDYNDYIRPPVTPTIATMNRAHSTHFSLNPDPAIPHVLRGWRPDGGLAAHDLTVGDMRVRNVVTNLRDGEGGTAYHGNSIFVFEMAEMCIAHLGHLHHTLAPEHIRGLGRIDVVLVPVDGVYTLDRAGMIDVLTRLQAPVMVPMHYFGPTTLARFLDEVGTIFPVERRDEPSLVLSRDTLPKRPTLVVLPGR